ncbi:hypothetical protein D3C87_1527950 [compost metagenome]
MRPEFVTVFLISARNQHVSIDVLIHQAVTISATDKLIIGWGFCTQQEGFQARQVARRSTTTCICVFGFSVNGITFKKPRLPCQSVGNQLTKITKKVVKNFDCVFIERIKLLHMAIFMNRQGLKPFRRAHDRGIVGRVKPLGSTRSQGHKTIWLCHFITNNQSHFFRN